MSDSVSLQIEYVVAALACSFATIFMNRTASLCRLPIVKVLYLNRVTVVRKKGKVVRNQAIVVVGNGKGLCGIGKAKDPIASLAIEKATKRAHR